MNTACIPTSDTAIPRRSRSSLSLTRLARVRTCAATDSSPGKESRSARTSSSVSGGVCSEATDEAASGSASAERARDASSRSFNSRARRSSAEIIRCRCCSNSSRDHVPTRPTPTPSLPPGGVRSFRLFYTWQYQTSVTDSPSAHVWSFTVPLNRMRSPDESPRFEFDSHLSTCPCGVTSQ